MQLLADVPSLVPWTTFYEIVGCSGGALVGLQFVVIALIANTRGRADYHAINAFGTPNVVHFSTAFTVSVIMCAPWPSLSCASIAIATCGIFGLLYSGATFRRALHQTAYKPVLEDWIFYSITPLGIYVMLSIAGCLMNRYSNAEFVVAGAAVSLLLIGIRNSWDSVTHVVTEFKDEKPKPPTS